MLMYLLTWQGKGIRFILLVPLSLILMLDPLYNWLISIKLYCFLSQKLFSYLGTMILLCGFHLLIFPYKTRSPTVNSKLTTD